VTAERLVALLAGIGIEISKRQVVRLLGFLCSVAGRNGRAPRLSAPGRVTAFALVIPVSMRDASLVAGAGAHVGQHGRTEQILDGATADGGPDCQKTIWIFCFATTSAAHSATSYTMRCELKCTDWERGRCPRLPLDELPERKPRPRAAAVAPGG
jgi:hypothetical protein